LGAERQAPKITQERPAFAGFLAVFAADLVYSNKYGVAPGLAGCRMAQKKALYLS
jgi:hypothetical protein